MPTRHKKVALRKEHSILDPGVWTPYIWLTVVLRLGAAAYIFFQPLAGMLASFFMDWFDSYLLIQRAGISRAKYHELDKNLDQVWSVVMLIAGWNTPYRMVLVVLYLYRLLGHAAFLLSHDIHVFLFFPNVFEFAFFWFVALVPWIGTFSVHNSWLILILLTMLKLVQEVSLHYIWPARLRYMKKHWNGYSPALRVLGWKRLGI